MLEAFKRFKRLFDDLIGIFDEGAVFMSVLASLLANTD